MFRNSNISESSSQSDINEEERGSEHSSDAISKHSSEDENDNHQIWREDQDDEQHLSHTSDESDSVGISNVDVTFASRVLRRLLNETKDQEQTRRNVYQQNTATTFRKICEVLNIPFSPSDTKLLLYSSLTASVSWFKFNILSGTQTHKYTHFTIRLIKTLFSSEEDWCN